MSKKFFILLLSISSAIVFAVGNDLTPEQKKIVAEIEFTVEVNQVKDILKEFIYHLEKGKPGGTPLKPIDYDIVSRRIERWINYPWFIADTGLSRAWLKKIHELIVYMAKTKRYLNAAKFSGDTQNEKYPQAVKYYDVAYQRFIALAGKPVKVSEKIQREQQLQKVLWQREMRKKYKIKENQQPEM